MVEYSFEKMSFFSLHWNLEIPKIQDKAININRSTYSNSNFSKPTHMAPSVKVSINSNWFATDLGVEQPSVLFFAL